MLCYCVEAYCQSLTNRIKSTRTHNKLKTKTTVFRHSFKCTQTVLHESLFIYNATFLSDAFEVV